MELAACGNIDRCDTLCVSSMVLSIKIKSSLCSITQHNYSIFYLHGIMTKRGEGGGHLLNKTNISKHEVQTLMTELDPLFKFINLVGSTF